MATPENQGGGEGAIDAVAGGGSRSRRGASGSAGLNTDVSQLETVDRLVTRLDRSVKSLAKSFGQLKTATAGVFTGILGGKGAVGGGIGGGTPGTVEGSMNASKAGLFTRMAMGSGGSVPPTGIGAMMAASSFGRAVAAPIQDISAATSSRIGRGAQYSLSADRMSVLYQQMYGMTNAQVRGNVRMPMTENYLLGGPGAINQMMGLQASTGLSAVGQARSVEAFRAMSGFSLSGGQAAQMIGTLATPDVANRMFMMGGGTGMYGIGGQQRSAMQVIQDIVRRTGLTNPDALKGALQPGSNTRQRLSAMGLPQDMQDMVIQYAMQNTQYQKQTGSKATMYDPSLEADRRTMGIEGSYAVQHEKTAGEMAKREERFYGRQVDNFADFERNLRTATKALAALEDTLSGLIGAGISVAGHPVTKLVTQGLGYAAQAVQSYAPLMGTTGDAAPPTATPLGGGATVTNVGPGGGTAQVDPENERFLSKLKPELAGPLRRMIMERPSLRIGEGYRSKAQQEASFKQRYRLRPDWTEKSKDDDRIWNGQVWEKIPGTGKNLAAPGSSLHQEGLAVDLHFIKAEDRQWVIENASRFGLDHGGTGSGGDDDEPHHIQPKGYWNKVVKDTEKAASGSATGTSGLVRTSSSTGLIRDTVSGGGTTRSGGAMVSSAVAFAANTAGATAGELGRVGLTKQVGTLIQGIDKPHEMSSSAQKLAKLSKASTGDATGPMTSSSGVRSQAMMQSGNYSITISPNINISTTGSMSGDLKSMAREIGRLLEDEVKVRMMRTD